LIQPSPKRIKINIKESAVCRLWQASSLDVAYFLIVVAPDMAFATVVHGILAECGKK
jgi:hypothetical protein